MSNLPDWFPYGGIRPTPSECRQARERWAARCAALQSRQGTSDRLSEILKGLNPNEPKSVSALIAMMTRSELMELKALLEGEKR